MAYKRKLNQAKEKVDADLKTSEAVAEKRQADPARDRFLDLTEREREAVREYLYSVTKNPSVRFKPSPDPSRLAIDHSSVPIPHPILMNALGSTDPVFIDGIISQLANGFPPDGFGVDLRALNFAFSVIKDIAPKSHLQTMFAAQMVSIHTAIMKYGRHVEPAGGWVDDSSAARTLTKLVHASVTLVDAFLRLRSAEEKVAQHVSMAGGQGIVGNNMQAPDEMDRDRKAGASARATLAGTNVVRIPERAKQVAKGTFGRRPTK